MNKKAKNILLVLVLIGLLVIACRTTRVEFKNRYDAGKNVGWDKAVLTMMQECKNEGWEINRGFNSSCYYVLTPKTNNTCEIKVFC